MSHTADSNAEPNLVPLLDLVLQLVMFFMMCAHFAVIEQTDESIKLPYAALARPIPEQGIGREVVFLNVSAAGEVKVTDRPPMKTDGELREFLKQAYDAALTDAKKLGQKEVATTVVVRAHENADFGDVYKVMRRCQEVGLRKMQLRVIRPGK